MRRLSFEYYRRNVTYIHSKFAIRTSPLYEHRRYTNMIVAFCIVLLLPFIVPLVALFSAFIATTSHLAGGECYGRPIRLPHTSP